MTQIIQRYISYVLFSQILSLINIEGLSLYPASDLTVENFTLVCDFQGTAWTDTLLFSYDGSPGGGCGSPPNPTCGSSIGIITPSTQTVSLTLNQNEILSKGNAKWTCTHGIVPANYNATVIALCKNIEVKYAEEKMDISCSCGYPSVHAELNYKASQNGESLLIQTYDLANSTGTNCTTDPRAMDYSSKFVSFPSGTMEVCATVMTYSQTTTPKTICKLVQDTNMNTSTIVPFNSTTMPPSSSHDIENFFWILIGCGALLCIVVVIIVMKCVSAQRTKKTLQDGSNLHASHAQEISGFTLSNTIQTKTG